MQKLGGDVSTIKNKEGDTLLHITCKDLFFSDAKIVDFLLGLKTVNINQRNNAGYTTFQVACEWGYYINAIRLIDQGAVIDLTLPNGRKILDVLDCHLKSEEESSRSPMGAAFFGGSLMQVENVKELIKKVKEEYSKRGNS